MLLLGEVAPAAPALGLLVEIAVCLFAFAFVWTIRHLLEALFGGLIAILSYIPKVGGLLAGSLHTAEQAVANALGSAEHAIDAAIGASWHELARYMDWLWREIRGHAVLLVEMATGIWGLALAVRVVRALLHHGAATGSVTSARVRTLEREYHGIEAQVRTVERELRGIDEVGIKARLGNVETEIGTIEAQTIPAIQQAESDAASAINNLYDWVKGKASLLGVGTFATAVAAALGVLGLGGLSCPSFLRLLGKPGCWLGNALEDLLGLVISALVLTNICDMLGLLETAYGDVAGPLISFLTEIPLGGCETPPDGWALTGPYGNAAPQSAWAVLAVPAGPLPPLQTLGALPV